MHSTSSAASQAPSSAYLSSVSMAHSLIKSSDTDSLLFGNTQRQDPMGDGSRSNLRLDSKGKGRAITPVNGDILALDLGSAEEGTAAQNGDAFMQMELVEQQVGSFRGSCLWMNPLTTASFYLGHLHPVKNNSY